MSFQNPASLTSPVQKHQVQVANDLQWVIGELETLGNPHHYINQDDLDFLTIGSARVLPWDFTGLPHSRAPEIILARQGIQMLMFSGDEAWEQFRKAPRTETVILNLPLAVVRGQAPFLSEAQLGNFLDFWKGLYFPVIEARIHYLASNGTQLPTGARLIYINRSLVQSYIRG